MMWAWKFRDYFTPVDPKRGRATPKNRTSADEAVLVGSI